MPATRRLVLDLPEETVADIEARVAAGEYADAGAVVAAGVTHLLALHADDDPDFDEDDPEWVAIIAECDESERRIDAGLEQTFSVDEVFDRLRARLDGPRDRRRAS